MVDDDGRGTMRFQFEYWLSEWLPRAIPLRGKGWLCVAAFVASATAGCGTTTIQQKIGRQTLTYTVSVHSPKSEDLPLGSVWGARCCSSTRADGNGLGPRPASASPARTASRICTDWECESGLEVVGHGNRSGIGVFVVSKPAAKRLAHHPIRGNSGTGLPSTSSASTRRSSGWAVSAAASAYFTCSHGTGKLKLL